MMAEIQREKEYERGKRERKEAEKRRQIMAEILRQKGEEYERRQMRAEMLREMNAKRNKTQGSSGRQHFRLPNANIEAGGARWNKEASSARTAIQYRGASCSYVLAVR
jgi:hypothetical protein